MPSTDAPRIALVPERAPAWMSDAITTGGGQLVATGGGRGAGVGQPQRRRRPRPPPSARRPGIRWVQLPWAGVEQFVHLMDDDRLWTCGKGVYAEPVAELALTLALAGHAWSRHLRPGGDRWEPPQGTNLLGRPGHHPRRRWHHRGAAAAAASPFDCHVTVVRNRAQDMDGRRRGAGERPADRRRCPAPTSWCVALAAHARDRGHHQRQRAAS